MPQAENQVSQTIERLRWAVSDGDTRALNDFWKEVHEQGAPLIEPIQDDDEHSLVTFLWRSEHVAGVNLVSMMTSQADHQMSGNHKQP